MKVGPYVIKVPAIVLEDGTVQAIGCLSRNALQRAVVAAKSQGHEPREVMVEIKEVDRGVKAKLLHKWVVSWTDVYGDLTGDRSSRAAARRLRKNLLEDAVGFGIKNVSKIKHEVYELVKTEEVV